MYIYLLHKVKQPSGCSANNSSGSPCILAEEGAEASLGRCNGFLKVVGPIRWQFRPKPMTANPYCPLPHRRGPRALSASQTSWACGACAVLVTQASLSRAALQGQGAMQVRRPGRLGLPSATPRSPFPGSHPVGRAHALLVR